MTNLLGPRFSSLLTLAVLAGADPGAAAGPVVLTGTIRDRGGNHLTGVEVRLTDRTGTLRYRAFSDAAGRYRFPPLPAPRSPSGFRAVVSHARYLPLQVPDVLEGATVTLPRPSEIAPTRSGLALASSTLVSRDFQLLAPHPVAQAAAAGPIDPNLMEYYFQQGLLLLARNQKRDAVRLLKIYAQSGFNPRQVTRALELIANNED